MRRCAECDVWLIGTPEPGKIALCRECYEEEIAIKKAIAFISREIGKQMRQDLRRKD